MYAFLFIAFLAKLDQLMSIFKHFRMKRASLLQDSTKAFTTSLLSLNYRSWIIDETYKVQMYVEFCVERMMLQKLILFVKKTFRDKKQAKPSHAARLVQEQKIKFESQKIVFFSFSLDEKELRVYLFWMAGGGCNGRHEAFFENISRNIFLHINMMTTTARWQVVGHSNKAKQLHLSLM